MQSAPKTGSRGFLGNAVGAVQGRLRAIRPGLNLTDTEAEDIVRAVLKAIRDPDRRVVRGMTKALSPGRRPTEAWVSVEEKHRIRWRAAIDAVLEHDYGPPATNAPAPPVETPPKAAEAGVLRRLLRLLGRRSPAP